MLYPLQAGYINADQEMYDPNSDSCAIARTSNLNEELGLVKYVMSDKTGTLTRNVMKFKRVSVAGRVFGDNETDEFDDDALIEEYRYAPLTKNGIQIKELLTMMAVCHTVVPEDKDGELSYQCSSPDEGALVRGAAAQGFVFHTRKPKKVILSVVVEMVRSLGNHVVMAVGDGANDVAMIQAANVGIGISGEEGLQAASASDYAIPRFHFLRRLLL
ncbi:hypothetical protein TELCIR_20014, partial [Teladorsagia circumcincta]